ncbi:MAG: rsmH [Francisellaceae bacterium]|nr:rsmH [Francisellaceae bacterium]
MVKEVLTGLNLHPNGIYIDATFGRGGHSRAILEKLGPQAKLFALDKDPEAVKEGTQLALKDNRFEIIKNSFTELLSFCRERGLNHKINGILMDLGVSSPQLDNPERGFSFQTEGPLDMRMDNTQLLTAHAFVNSAEEDELSRIFKEYGEERYHRRIARAIIESRELLPISTTTQLSQIIAKAHPAWEKHKHPATRVFQAIRIYINQELHDLEIGLANALETLCIGGRLVVISFHSLEDRIVKRFMDKNKAANDIPADFPFETNQAHKRIKKMGKKIKAQAEEINDNPRARSAILRIGEKIA